MSAEMKSNKKTISSFLAKLESSQETSGDQKLSETKKTKKEKKRAQAKAKALQLAKEKIENKKKLKK